MTTGHPEDPLLRFLQELDRTSSEGQGIALLLRFAAEVAGDAVGPSKPDSCPRHPSLLDVTTSPRWLQPGIACRHNRYLFIKDVDALGPAQLAMLESASRMLEHRFRHERDSLTGLISHRVFREKLTSELNYAKQHPEPLVLVFVDTDNFRALNETQGFAMGDTILQEIAELLQDRVRSKDIVCRHEGDEFVLLLTNTSKKDATRLCEGIRDSFQLRFGAGPTVLLGPPLPPWTPVTTSIGLACYPDDADSEAGLWHAADDALYASKRGGRNKVTAAGPKESRGKIIPFPRRRR